MLKIVKIYLLADYQNSSQQINTKLIYKLRYISRISQSV
jgi:hypothetical protein